MTSALRRLPAAALLVLAALLTACGGSPGPSPNVVDTTAITVQPSATVLYPGVPVTLLITGGTGSYVVASNNQSIVPIVTAGVGHQLTVIANPVNAETVVTLSIRDTGTTPQTTASLTVRPGTIANAVSVVPVSSECNTGTGANTALFLCSGGEALVTTTISQAGVILPARAARFDVVSGDVRFIVTPVGTTGEVLATSTTVVSDQNGLVRVRLRALPGAAAQNALIQITDPETLAFQRVVVPIVQLPGPGGTAFFAVPDSLTFTGPFVGQCANVPAADVVIFGGTPPYNVRSANSQLAVSPGVVGVNGGSFHVQSVNNGCFASLPVTITDAAGRTIIVTFTNQEGTRAVPAITLAPSTFNLSCGTSVSFSIGGGQEPFSASSSHPRVAVAVSGRTLTATRLTGDGAATHPTSGSVAVTDGSSTASSTSTFSVAGTGIPANCP